MAFEELRGSDEVTCWKEETEAHLYLKEIFSESIGWDAKIFEQSDSSLGYSRVSTREQGENRIRFIGGKTSTFSSA